MATYSWKARSARGELVRGTTDAAAPAAVADELLSTGMTPVEIVPLAAAAAGADLSETFSRLREPKVTESDTMMFSRQMYTLLKAGVPILRALSGLEDSERKASFRRVLGDLRESLGTGRELAATLHRHPKVFSPFYCAMIRVGETTGNLDEVFLRLFKHLDFEKEMRERMKAALRYPMFVIGAMAVALVVINLVVIPAFDRVYKSFQADLPIMTQMLVAFSKFMQASWPLMLAGLIGGGLAFRSWIATEAGRYRWDRFKLRVPFAGPLILKGALSRFGRTLSLSLRAGIPVTQSLGLTARVVGNAYIGARIEQMRDSVERGEPLSRTAATAGVFTSVVLQMISVGEETGDLDGLLQEVGDLYQREVEYEIQTMSARIEPVLIIAMGVLVAILALGVFLPVWELSKAAMPH